MTSQEGSGHHMSELNLRPSGCQYRKTSHLLRYRSKQDKGHICDQLERSDEAQIKKCSLLCANTNVMKVWRSYKFHVLAESKTNFIFSYICRGMKIHQLTSGFSFRWGSVDKNIFYLKHLHVEETKKRIGAKSERNFSC